VIRPPPIAVRAATHVTPDTAELAEPLAHADEAEAGAEMEPQARLVLREDPRLQRPDAGRLRPRDQRVEQRPADAAASQRIGDIDAHLGHAAVAAAVRVAGEGRPAADAVAARRDEADVGGP